MQGYESNNSALLQKGFIRPHCTCPEKFEHSQIRLKVCETTEGKWIDNGNWARASYYIFRALELVAR